MREVEDPSVDNLRRAGMVMMDLLSKDAEKNEWDSDSEDKQLLRASDTLPFVTVTSS
jgi:hypothetical protein